MATQSLSKALSSYGLDKMSTDKLSWLSHARALHKEARSLQLWLDSFLASSSKLPSSDLSGLRSYCAHLDKERTDEVADIRSGIDSIIGAMSLASQTDGPRMTRLMHQASQALMTFRSKQRARYQTLLNAEDDLQGYLEEFMANNSLDSPLKAGTPHSNRTVDPTLPTQSTIAASATSSAPTDLPATRSNGTATTQATEHAAQSPAYLIQHEIESIEKRLQSAGGDLGHWPKEDHALFVAALTSLHATLLDVGLWLSSDNSMDSVSPEDAAAKTALHELVSRICLRVPLQSEENIRKHLQWWVWRNSLLQRKRDFITAWKQLKVEERARQAATAAQAEADVGQADADKARPRTAPAPAVDASVKASLAEWRRTRDAQAKRKAQEAELKAAQKAMEDSERRERAQQRAKQQLAAWKPRHDVAGDDVTSGADGTVAAGHNRSRIITTPAELAARAAESIQIARARQSAVSAKQAEKAAAAARLRGRDFHAGDRLLSPGTLSLYAAVKSDPVKPTIASQQREASTEDLRSFVDRLAGVGAHEAPVASVVPSRLAAGRTASVAVARPFRATPAWMKA
jgi:hypothetical protein